MVDQTSTSGSVGAGQQEPEDGNSDFTVYRFIVEQMQAELEVMMPVQVVTFHAGAGSPPASGTVDVQLLVSQIDGAGNVTQQGTVFGVPVWRLQGGKWAVICDPAAKDFGYIIGGSRDASNVVKNPGIQQPGSRRKYSYSDGFYMGGVLNSVPEATFWLKSDGTLQASDAKGNVLETSSTGMAMSFPAGGGLTVNGNLIVADNLQLGGALQGATSGSTYAGNIATSGNVTAGSGGADSVGLQSHKHSGVQTGGGESGAPVAGT